MISTEDFDAWRDNLVTQAVFRALGTKAAECKERWQAASWDAGQVNAVLLADLRARAQAWTDISEITHGELEAILEPERD